MSNPATKVGREQEPCRDCAAPIGPKGAWWEHPLWESRGYGLCPPCHQTRWDEVVARPSASDS